MLLTDASETWHVTAPRRIDTERLSTTAAVIALILLAFALRLLPVLIAPSLNWADEIFQTTEQAHRLVYGNGLVPWEFQLGARSWILPGAIAGLMEFSRLFGDGPRYYLPVIAGACGVLAIVPVVCGLLWCRHWFSGPAAFVGGLSVVVAPELVYMGDRTLTEVLAAHVLVLGLYLLDPGYRVDSRPRLFWAGAVLGLAFALRIQIAPAIALVAAWTAVRGGRRSFLTVAFGGVSVLACVAMLDAATLGSPLASIWRYALYNLYYGVSSTFGVEPWYFYALQEFAIWGPFALLFSIFGLLGARRLWLPFAAAAAIVAVHSFIPHKEYRFIYPAVVLIAVESGLGLAALVDRARDLVAGSGSARKLARRAVPVVIAVLWCAVCFRAWTGTAMAMLRSSSNDQLMAASFASRQSSVCGIGMYAKDNQWMAYGGYSRLHLPVPLYWMHDQAELTSRSRNFDILLYPVKLKLKATVLPPGFVVRRCFGNICVARREGPCEPRKMTPLALPSQLRGLAPQR